jgi:hypothetical protein
MIAKLVSVPMLPTNGQLVRVRPVNCNRRHGESGVIVHVKLSVLGERALDRYIVQFDDRDQEEFWSIQLDQPPARSSDNG